MNDSDPNKRPKPNRRTSVRHKPRSDCKVECRKGDTGLGPNLAVSLLDVSQTGVRLVLKTALNGGDAVEISLGGTGAMLVKRSAVVIWALTGVNGCYAAGFRFRLSLNYAETKQISKP